MNCTNVSALVEELLEVIRDMQDVAGRVEGSAEECPLATRAGEFFANTHRAQGLLCEPLAFQRCVPSVVEAWRE